MPLAEAALLGGPPGPLQLPAEALRPAPEELGTWLRICSISGTRVQSTHLLVHFVHLETRNVFISFLMLVKDFGLARAPASYAQDLKPVFPWKM